MPGGAGQEIGRLPALSYLGHVLPRFVKKASRQEKHNKRIARYNVAYN